MRSRSGKASAPPTIAIQARAPIDSRLDQSSDVVNVLRPPAATMPSKATPSRQAVMRVRSS
jgi:hypothetical protein